MAKKQAAVPDLIEELTKSIIHKKEVKYDPEIHIYLLLKLFSEGKTVATFAVYAGIRKDHFYQWLDKHKDFQQAYEIAKSLAEHYWMSLGETEFNSIGFNFNFWQKIMAVRFGYASTRTLKIKGFAEASKLIDKHEILCKEGSNGHLTTTEANQLSALLLAGAKLEEHTQVKKDVERIKGQLGIAD